MKQQEYFKQSQVCYPSSLSHLQSITVVFQTILVRLADSSIWQSRNEGYSWEHLLPDKSFLAFYIHRYAPDRAYLVSGTNEVYRTLDTGKTWSPITVPLPANSLGIAVMSFHPLQSDWIIWVGSTPGCTDYQADCHAEAHYTIDNGRNWEHIESYVKGCAWARDTDLKIDSRLVICESYRDKTGSQALFRGDNPVELWVGSKFYKDKHKLFDNVVGFAKFSEYLIVAEVRWEQ